MYTKLRTSDQDYFLPFFDSFCAEEHPVRRQKSHHVYDVYKPISKSETEMLGVVGILKCCAN